MSCTSSGATVLDDRELAELVRRTRLEGWVPFGTHAPYPDVPIEFSAELDEGGLPLWERVREP